MYGTRIYDKVEQQPSFPGGLNKLLSWLNTNLSYPVSAQREGIQGKVIAQFVINKDGSICDIKIIQSIRYDLDMEVIRVLSLMPKWSPGYINNHPVRVRFTLPITFRLK